ncbi:MAG: type IV pilus modification protein PilV [Halioglobus sp.]
MISDRAGSPTGKSDTGFALVEVLVAVLVSAIGVLGLAAMQISAKRAIYEAAQRSIATNLAGDMLERMRSNPSALAAYRVMGLEGPATPSTRNCSMSVCSALQLAAHDLFEWSALLQGASESVEINGRATDVGGLAAASACITHTAGLVSVALSWRGVHVMANPTESSCGNSDASYGPSSGLRRLLVMTSYIGVQRVQP